MRSNWPTCAASIPLSIWAMIRQREALDSRTEFLNKMREPEMQAMLAELAGRDWQIHAQSLATLVGRTSRGFVFIPGPARGRIPFLNPDQILQLKDRIRVYQAIGRTDFVHLALEIHTEGLALTAKWLEALHHYDMARAVREEAQEAVQRSRTWVNRMVERCKLVILAGEDLQRIGPGGARLKFYSTGSDTTQYMSRMCRS